MSTARPWWARAFPHEHLALNNWIANIPHRSMWLAHLLQTWNDANVKLPPPLYILRDRLGTRIGSQKPVYHPGDGVSIQQADGTYPATVRHATADTVTVTTDFWVRQKNGRVLYLPVAGSAIRFTRRSDGIFRRTSGAPSSLLFGRSLK